MSIPLITGVFSFWVCNSVVIKTQYENTTKSFVSVFPKVMFVLHLNILRNGDSRSNGGCMSSFQNQLSNHLHDSL